MESIIFVFPYLPFPIRYRQTSQCGQELLQPETGTSHRPYPESDKIMIMITMIIIIIIIIIIMMMMIITIKIIMIRIRIRIIIKPRIIE
jgi:hypothetical protein